MGWGKASEADKKLGREGNHPGPSKSELASHSGTSRFGPRCSYKKSEKAPSESPLDVPGWSCGSSSLNTRLTSSLRILLFRVTAPKSADSRECVLPAWLRVLAPCRPAHRLLSAGSREGLREGVATCASARFLA
jgi:hypothetical protein